MISSACTALRGQAIPLPFGPEPHYGRPVTDILIEGNEVTDESVILEALVTKVGDVYSAEDAVRDYNRLLQLGVFTAIVFRTEEDGDGVALTVVVAETSPYLPAVSFALTDENGLEIGPAFSSPNLFGRASKASAFLRFGEARNFGLTFRDSWRPTERWYDCCWTLEYYHRDRHNDLDDFREISDEAVVQFMLNATDRLHVGPRFEYLDIGAKADSLGLPPGAILDGDGSDDVPGLGIVAEYDARNLSNYPTVGWYLAVSAVQHGGFLGGPADYPRLDVDLRRYVEIAGPIHSVALYSLLTLTSGRVGIDIPVHQDFHLGGTNSVRGWPLGTRAGKNQWLGTIEYWWNILPRSAYQIWFFRWSMGLQLAAFADAGAAWNDGNEFRSQWIGGGGLGARLVIPQAGLIRFDLGVGQGGPDVRVQFHLGAGERAVAQRARVR